MSFKPLGVGQSRARLGTAMHVEGPLHGRTGSQVLPAPVCHTSHAWLWQDILVQVCTWLKVIHSGVGSQVQVLIG